MTPKHDININADGTFQQDKINIAYNKLVDIFGEPHHEVNELRIDRKWLLQFDDGTVAIIYNWKNGANWQGDDSILADSITDWCIGGCTQRAADLIKQSIEGVAA